MAMNLSQFRESLQTSALTTWVSSHLEKLLVQALRQGPVPKHLALVMDGNRRFARKHNISTARGHMLGAEVMEKTLEICYMCGVRVVTIYAFSIENFKRPKSQVDSIMELSKLYLCSMSERGGLLDRYGVAMRVLGRLELLDPDVLSTIQHRTDLTRDYGDKILNVCFSYTSRDEIATAIKQTVADCKIPMKLSHECPALPLEVYKSEIIKPQSAKTKIFKQESFCSGSVEAFRGDADKARSDLVPDSSTKRSFHFFSPPSLCDDLDEKSVNVGQPMVILRNITAETLTDHMLTADNPPLDLLIRTSGVRRLSDFLLWQCHQETHVVFLETLWPDFGLWQFFSVIREWQRGKHNSINENRKKRLSQIFHPVVHRILPIVNHHLCTSESIQKDIKGLSRLPEHLSVIVSLRKEDYALQRLMDEVAELAAWSACARIPTLSVYEKNGILRSYIPALYQVITSKLSSYYGNPSEQPVVRVFASHHGVYCPSPAQSALKKSNPIFMNLLLLSASDGRETLVDLTKSLAERSQSGKLSLDDINIELIDAKISEVTSQPSQSIPALNDIDPSSNDSNGSYSNLAENSPLLYSVKPEPDLLFIHGPYIKLDGYPPWQIRLTEMFCMDEKSSSIIGRGKAVKYQVFLRGLCQYAGAQMRFGR